MFYRTFWVMGRIRRVLSISIQKARLTRIISLHRLTPRETFCAPWPVIMGLVLSVVFSSTWSRSPSCGTDMRFVSAWTVLLAIRSDGILAVLPRESLLLTWGNYFTYSYLSGKTLFGFSYFEKFRNVQSPHSLKCSLSLVIGWYTDSLVLG